MCRRMYKNIIAVLTLVVLMNAVLFVPIQARAATVNQDELKQIISSLLIKIAELKAQLKLKQSAYQQQPEESIPVIESDALIRVQNPPLIQLSDGKTLTFKPWQTAMFRWDGSFSFDETAKCFVNLKYGEKTLKESYEETEESSGHIGFYAPIVTEYGQLQSIKVDCDSDEEEFEAFVKIKTNGPVGTGALTINSSSVTTNNLSYSSALSKCLKSAIQNQSDTKCVWSGYTIVDIKERGEGIQSAQAFFNGYN